MIVSFIPRIISVGPSGLRAFSSNCASLFQSIRNILARYHHKSWKEGKWWQGNFITRKSNCSPTDCVESCLAHADFRTIMVVLYQAIIHYFYITCPLIFQQVYQFTEYQAGLGFLSLLIGSLVGLAIHYRHCRRVCLPKAWVRVLPIMYSNRARSEIVSRFAGRLLDADRVVLVNSTTWRSCSLNLLTVI